MGKTSGYEAWTNSAVRAWGDSDLWDVKDLDISEALKQME